LLPATEVVTTNVLTKVIAFKHATVISQADTSVLNIPLQKMVKMTVKLCYCTPSVICNKANVQNISGFDWGLQQTLNSLNTNLIP
jgi:hypothetical protein